MELANWTDAELSVADTVACHVVSAVRREDSGPPAELSHAPNAWDAFDRICQVGVFDRRLGGDFQGDQEDSRSGLQWSREGEGPVTNRKSQRTMPARPLSLQLSAGFRHVKQHTGDCIWRTTVTNGLDRSPAAGVLEEKPGGPVNSNT